MGLMNCYVTSDSKNVIIYPSGDCHVEYQTMPQSVVASCHQCPVQASDTPVISRLYKACKSTGLSSGLFGGQRSGPMNCDV